MSGFENESVKNFIDKMYEWSSDVDRKFLDNITKNNRNGYVSWKIPLPFDLLEDTAENKSIRGICVERMIWKLYILSKKRKN